MHKIDGTEKCFGDCYSYEKKEELQIKACSELGDMFVDYRNEEGLLEKRAHK
jgi:hypothetical protein